MWITSNKGEGSVRLHDNDRLTVKNVAMQGNDRIWWARLIHELKQLIDETDYVV